MWARRERILPLRAQSRLRILREDGVPRERERMGGLVVMVVVPREGGGGDPPREGAGGGGGSC